MEEETVYTCERKTQKFAVIRDHNLDMCTKK